MDSTIVGIITFFFGVGITAALFSYRTERQPRQQDFSRKHWWADWAKGLSTEMGGAVITTILLGVVLSQVQESRAQEQHKAELILQMDSPDNGFALEAVRQLRALGWLGDGHLRGADLYQANLPNIDLREANLEDAQLIEADLTGATLDRANLHNIDLRRANLNNVSLKGADLSGAYLLDANLEGVDFDAFQFDENTTLPDGTHWQPGRDMARFTDPNHPIFWRSDDPDSPAYRGD